MVGVSCEKLTRRQKAAKSKDNLKGVIRDRWAHVLSYLVLVVAYILLAAFGMGLIKSDNNAGVYAIYVFVSISYLVLAVLAYKHMVHQNTEDQHEIDCLVSA
jgi:quinol-cytochrome oxidoreductase complex cytochrome b subunit